MKKIDFKFSRVAMLIMLIMAFGFFIVSCKKEGIDINKDLPKKANPNFSFKIKTRSAGDGKNDAIGYGYNCFYAPGDNVNGVLNQVIDLERYKTGEGRDQNTGNVVNFPPGRIEEALPHGHASTHECYERNLEEFKKKLAVDFNANLSFIPWGGIQLSAEYDDRIETKKDYSFYKLDATIDVRRLYLSSSSVNRLKYFFTDEFLYALKHSTGEEILNDYGTHILTDITLGGKLSILSSAIEKSFQREELMKFSSNFFNKVKASVNQEIQISNQLRNTTLTIVQSGGSKIHVSKRHIDDNGSINTGVFNYKEWAESLNKQNASLIKTNKDRLIFICDLIDDPLIKAKVYAAFVAKQQLLKGYALSRYKEVPFELKIENKEFNRFVWFDAEYGKGSDRLILEFGDPVYPHLFDTSLPVIEEKNSRSWRVRFERDYITVYSLYLKKYLCTDLKFRTISEDKKKQRFWMPHPFCWESYFPE